MPDEITNGELGLKIDNLTGRVEEQIRLGEVGHKDHEDRSRLVEDKVTTLDQRVRHLTGVFGVLQGAMIAVITWLGLR